MVGYRPHLYHESPERIVAASVLKRIMNHLWVSRSRATKGMARQLVILHRRVLRVDVSWRYLESGYAWLQVPLRQTADKEPSS